MFDDLRDRVSLLFAHDWPAADGQLTSVSVYPYERGIQFVITYTFSLADGPYTGESRSPIWYPGEKIVEINDKFRVGQQVTVRYRSDDPTVNKLDRSTWDDLTGSLDDL